MLGLGTMGPVRGTAEIWGQGEERMVTAFPLWFAGSQKVLS